MAAASNVNDISDERYGITRYTINKFVEAIYLMLKRQMNNFLGRIQDFFQNDWIGGKNKADNIIAYRLL